MNEHQRGHPSLGHGSAHDTLRWGDSQTLEGLETLAGGESDQVISKQMVAAHWRWPLSWNLWVAFVPIFDSTETATFTATLNVTIGVGQAIMTFPISYALAPTAGVYVPVFDQKLVPAQDLQIRVEVTGKAALTNPTGTDSLTVGLFVAPQTEPHAFTMLMDRIVSGERPDNVPWMQEGFTEAPMGYRR
jgi:hypothetical protein